jgi:hypothetical protein
MTVVETIEEAERELAAGHNKQAARLLTDAAYHTHDPSIEAKVRELAMKGRADAFRLGKSRWDEIIRISELRGAGERAQDAKKEGI